VAGVSRSRSPEHGLGFAYKWNLGWMHDTLRYIEKDSIIGPIITTIFTFGLIYAFSEKFIPAAVA